MGACLSLIIILSLYLHCVNIMSLNLGGANFNVAI